MSNSRAAPRRPLRLLALDGGGIRGLSELTMLDAIMDRIAIIKGLRGEKRKNIRPCDYFDVIGGTSTGGIIAILLSRLRLTTKECLKIYGKMSERIFGKEKLLIGCKVERIFRTRFDANILKEVIRDELVDSLPLPLGSPDTTDTRDSEEKKEALLLDEVRLPDDSEIEPCRGFVCATPGKRPQKGNPVLFRTYLQREQGDRGGDGETEQTKQTGSSEVKIWEALRATSAAPGFFDKINIGGEDYVDGGLGCNNPAEQVYQEGLKCFMVGEILPEVGCFLSLGTGMPKTLPDYSVNEYNKEEAEGWFCMILLWIVMMILPIKKETLEELGRIATECENVHRGMLKKRELKGKYFRFNVQQGLQGISLEKWKQLPEVMVHTNVYLHEYETEKRLDEVAEKLAKLSSDNPDNWHI